MIHDLLHFYRVLWSMTRYIVVEPEKERLLEDLVAFRKRKTANSCHCVVVLHFTLTQQ